MSKPTDEQFSEAFEQAITSMQRLVGDAVIEGRGPKVSPSVMVLMRVDPDLPPPFSMIEINPLAKDGDRVKIAAFTPIALTPPGWPPMPTDLFWQVMKMIATASNAYGVVVGMEAWLAHTTDAEKGALPKSLENYDKREEAVVVTAEREGERRLYEAPMHREGDRITLGPWKTSMNSSGACKGLSGNMFQAVPANTRN